MIIKCRGITSAKLYSSLLFEIHNNLRIDLQNSIYRQIICAFLDEIKRHIHPRNKSEEINIDPVTVLVKSTNGEKTDVPLEYMCIYCLRSAIINSLVTNTNNKEIIQEYLKRRIPLLTKEPTIYDLYVDNLKKFKKIIDNDPRFEEGLTKTMLDELIEDDLDVKVMR